MIYRPHRCLVIPDVHQDVAWVERVFAKESNYDLIVFLGDYFDSNLPPKHRTGVAATCAFIDQLRVSLGNKAVFLLGNHDIQYLEAKPACDRYRTPRNLHYKCGSAFKHAAASKIAKSLPDEFWKSSRLFVSVNGWLLSHAGISNAWWPNQPTYSESLLALESACQSALQSVHFAPHPLLLAGKSRGGETEHGGLTWQDWDHEFSDNLACPQIVGHTGNPIGARQSGRSWCLDGHQTTYGILTPDGLRVRSC